jgi:hypothetical protein
MGVQSLWTGSVGRPLRSVLLGAGAVALLTGAAYASWMLITQFRVTRSSALLVVAGIGALLIAPIDDRVKQWRIVTLCLLALMPIQFSSFWSDYFSDYRVRSAFWLGGNIRGALEDLIDREQRDGAPRVYFSTLKSAGGQLDGRNEYMDAYWRFYLIKHNRQDLLSRTMAFDAAGVHSVPVRSLVLANADDITTGSLVKAGELKQVATIAELDRRHFFVILQR